MGPPVDCEASPVTVDFGVRRPCRSRTHTSIALGVVPLAASIASIGARLLRSGTGYGEAIMTLRLEVDGGQHSTFVAL